MNERNNPNDLFDDDKRFLADCIYHLTLSQTGWPPETIARLRKIARLPEETTTNSA